MELGPGDATACSYTPLSILCFLIKSRQMHTYVPCHISFFLEPGKISDVPRGIRTLPNVNPNLPVMKLLA
jgi:hypothetical protein